MRHSPDPPFAQPRAYVQRLAGAPISWGACEVPGWGEMPDPETVLSEMAALGLRGTELGAPGFLPDDPADTAALLGRHGLRCVGGFTALVLHEPELDVPAARRALSLLADGGGAELEQLSHELQGLAADPEIAEVAKELAAEVKETA